MTKIQTNRIKIYINTILIVLFSVSLYFINYSFWVENPIWDCWKISIEYLNDEISKFGNCSKEMTNTTYFSECDMIKAFEHLRYFCVNYWNIPKSKDQPISTDAKIPLSPYLLDHLLNIWFRKLDWNPKYLYQWLEPFEKSLERRNTLKIYIDDIDWKKTVADLQKDFQKQWLWIGNDQWLLKDYENICDSIIKIVQYDPLKNMIKEDNFKDRCLELVKIRNKQEIIYVSNLLINQWLKQVKWRLRNVLLDSLLLERFENLYQKFNQMLWIMSAMFKKLQWTKECS